MNVPPTDGDILDQLLHCILVTEGEDGLERLKEHARTLTEMRSGQKELERVIQEIKEGM